jgi:hypothetical protein
MEYEEMCDGVTSLRVQNNMTSTSPLQDDSFNCVEFMITITVVYLAISNSQGERKFVRDSGSST